MLGGGGGQNVGTILVTPWVINYISPGPLVRYGTGVNHCQMWLNIVIKFIRYPTDLIELTDVVQHDILSQTIAPFEYFFRSRLNCRISSVIKTLPSQICDNEIVPLTKLCC